MVLGKISFQYIMIPKLFINRKQYIWKKILIIIIKYIKTVQYTNNTL